LVKEKKIKTSIKNYGVDHPLKSNLIMNKFKKSIQDKYGVDNVSKSNVIKEKKIKTSIKNYGVDHPLKSEKIKKKQQEAIKNRYGVDILSKSQYIKDLKIKNSIEKYGVDSPFKSEVVKNRIKKTNLKKYGVEQYVSSTKHKDLLKSILEHNKKNKWKDYLKINIEDIINLDDDLFKITNYCNNHPEGFTINKYNLYNRIRYDIKNICTNCTPISEQSSFKEKEIKDFIKNDLKIENIIENDREILNGKEIDIYVPDYKLGIEFNGLYWHSEKFNNNNYHIEKTELAKSKNIQLIHIFEDEWIYKPDIVKSIIKSKLGLNNKSIYARKCEIKEISSKESKEFLDNNHIQGNVNSSIRIGLFYENELVSLMTFGKKRVAMGGKSENDEYEMYRFCNKLNTTIIGGASKLFKYFVNNYKPSEVISYADRRYFDGKMYEKLGFELEGISKPNYWYCKGLERKHRFNFRKDKLISEGFDSSKTEREIMIERGYNRIYDCGNLKYKF
jgi:hypothetical protein